MPETTQIIRGIDRQWILRASLEKDGKGDVWSAYDYSLYLHKAGLQENIITVNPMTRARFLQECEFIFHEPIYAVRFFDNPTPEALERFAKDVGQLKNIDDPRIVKIQDYALESVLEDQDEKEPGYPPFYVMDRIQGDTLKTLAEEKKAYEGKINESIVLMKDIGAALVSTHEAHINHRELHPKNILIQNDGSPVIIDFGVCQIIDGVCHILTGEADDVVNFMPPELTAGSIDEGNISSANDVYTFGKLLYYLISGGKQLPGEEHHAVEYDLRKTNPSKKMGLVYRILDKTICADISERIQTIEDLLTMINKELVEGTKCVYCGLGGYSPLSNKFLKEKWHMGQFEDQIPYAPRAFVCNMCGNIIYFSDTRILEDDLNQ